MERWAAAWCVMALAVSGCCQEDEKSVRLSGEVLYPAYSSGQIVVMASENVSNRCSGNQTMMETPGRVFAQATLDQPGKFSLTGKVRGIGSFPRIILRAFLSPDGYCVMLTLPPSDASDLSLVLQPGGCFFE